MLRHEIEEHRLHIEQLDEELERTENDRDEFSELLEEEQIRVEELTTEISLLRGRLSAVILQAVDLEAELERAKPERVLRRVLDAVNRARTECTNLEFARSAFETADRLQGPNPRDVLHDLKALDSAVAAWRSDTFPSAGLTSYLRDTSGLDFVARIGEDTLNRHGAQTVMVQRYLPAIAEGDKRVLVIGGQPVPYCLARIPQGGEVRGNLAAGGRGEARELHTRDREIAQALGPVLAARGLLLVGLDVIGDRLTEINVTSPTCFAEITAQTGFDVAACFIDALEIAVMTRRSGAWSAFRAGTATPTPPAGP